MSNYAVEDIEELLEKASIVPAVNQIEFNPFLYRRETLNYLEKKGIKVQAYRALRDGKAFDDATINAVARVSPARRRPRSSAPGASPRAPSTCPNPQNRSAWSRTRIVFRPGGGARRGRLLPTLATRSLVRRAAYQAAIRRRVVRDTPLSEDDPGIKRDITASS